MPKIHATDGLVCPQCQQRHLLRETLFIDAMNSEEVGSYRYTCADCDFIFEVPE